MSAEDPTIAEQLKGMGYATAQFGKKSSDDKTDLLLYGSEIGLLFRF